MTALAEQPFVTESNGGSLKSYPSTTGVDHASNLRKKSNLPGADIETAKELKRICP
jgi:hypothetical protein